MTRKFQKTKKIINGFRLKFSMPCEPDLFNFKHSVILKSKISFEKFKLCRHNSSKLTKPALATCEEILGNLRHPLSDIAKARLALPDKKCHNLKDFLDNASTCSESETDVLDSLIDDFVSIIDNKTGCDDFIALICKINSKLQGKEIFIREKKVFTEPDVHGYFWEYTDHQIIRSKLMELYNFLISAHPHPPILVAAVFIVQFNCLHPFIDGNGRTSRVIFNAILQKFGASRNIYIPCKNIFDICDRGFTIRLRYTFLKNDWEPVLIYFCDLVDFFVALHGNREEITVEQQI